MVDRIDKLDPNLYRVQETSDDRKHQGDDNLEDQNSPKKEPGKEKDKFNKEAPFSKLIGGQWDSPATTQRPSQRENTDYTVSEELSLSQRMMVVWGVVDLKGKPRLPVILSYAAVLTVIVVAAFFMVTLIWR